MKTIVLLCAVALLVPANAFARGGELSALTVGFPDKATPEARAKVMNFLKREFVLIEGRFINQFTRQRLAGSTAKINELVRLLNASHFELVLVFADLKDERVILALSQNMGGAEKITITINTTSKDFKWSELQIQIPPRSLGEIG